MVSAETRRKFEAKGVTLVEPEGGALACLDEILRGPLDEVEIVLGAGPWESGEARFEKLPEPAADSPKADCSDAPWPLLSRATSGPGPRGGRLLTTTLSCDHDLYLNHHRIGDTPVLPAAVAAEIAAEAAATVWPGWQVAEISDLRLFSGFKLDDDRARGLEIVVLGSEHGDAGGFSASVELRSAGEGGRSHYRASVKLVDALPEEPVPSWVRGFAPAAAELTARQAYREIMFAGPSLQTITRLVGLDQTGSVAEILESEPGFLVRGAQPASTWLFDPALIDTAGQLAWLWSYVRRGAGALPNRIGRVTRFAGCGAARRIICAAEQGLPEHEVCVHAVVLDGSGRMVLAVEALQGTANPALNRFCGWAGEIKV